MSQATRSECPACGHDDYKSLFHGTDRLYRTTDRSFTVVECAKCRLMRLFPQPRPSELSQFYPAQYWFSPGDSPAARAEERYRRFVLNDHVRFVESAIEATPTRGTVLDVGCGGGLFLRLLRERGHRVVGLDNSLDAAQVAWKQNRVAALCGSLTRAPFRPGQFTTITMFHVLEHLYDPMAFCEAAKDLLTDDGRLVIQVPNAACWQFLLFGEHWNGIDIPRHLVNFKEKDLVDLLDASGFTVTRRKHFSLRDNPAGLATTIAVGLDPMARRVRKVKESPQGRLVKDALYFALMLACIPPTLVEAACRAGSTIMVEARKK
ncbi:MAG: class I SAM-dependent methyltransferase [Acidobacteria bacterium]|nr:class I SAM-dependent methyltransferase [Acidobacteriota bacterium]